MYLFVYNNEGKNIEMTYCLGMKIKEGLIFMSDTRTNSGVDNISSYKKIFNWTKNNKASITILTAGNLATTQALVSEINGRNVSDNSRALELFNQTTMFQASKFVGKKLKKIIDSNSNGGLRADSSFDATIILGGQIKGGEPRIFLIYPQGNFIEVSQDNPFFQIGETKYGKPILVRGYDYEMGFSDAVKLMLLSFDSTIKANLSVGFPLDLHIYKANSFKEAQIIRIESDNKYYSKISNGWSKALKSALDSMPNFPIE